MRFFEAVIISASICILYTLFMQYNKISDSIVSTNSRVQITRVTSSNHPISTPRRLVALCVTGQLARLELLSKIRHLVLPSILAGDRVHLYIYLDSEVDDVGQTLWEFNYSTTPFVRYNVSQLKTFIISSAYRESRKFAVDSTLQTKLTNEFRVFVRLEPIPRVVFQVVDNKILVDHKQINVTVHNAWHGNHSNNVVRFQMNLRMMSGIRECAKWIMSDEVENGYFYDMVVRVRDDSYFFAPWKITCGETSCDCRNVGLYVSNSIIDDRQFDDNVLIIGRQYLEYLFRSSIEDMYFNSTLRGKFWGDFRGRIKMIADTYSIPLAIETNICQMPVVPLRGLKNPECWLVHPVYASALNSYCRGRNTAKQTGSCCTKLTQHMITSLCANIK